MVHNTSNMLCGCSSGRKKNKKARNDLSSYYGQPESQNLISPPPLPPANAAKSPRRSRHHRHKHEVDKHPLARRQNSLRCDQEYPDLATSNPMVSTVDPDCLTDPDEELLRHQSVPILEFCEKEPDKNQMQFRKMYQAYKGQLNVSVYVNYGLLTVHVIEGKDLSSTLTDRPSSHIYVRVSLLPDDMGRSHCKTKPLTELDNPVFQEKFSFELLDEDSDRRVLLSVWRKQHDRRDAELAGCMSFGIRNILQKSEGASGWYYLLSEYIGKRKHLHAKKDKDPLPSHQHRSLDSSTKQPRDKDKLEEVFSTLELTDPNASTLDSTGLGSDDSGYDSSHYIEMKATEQGCGLTLTGGCPAKVFIVEPGSPAERAGLKPEDCVLSINQVSVARCTAETVARLVRNCEDIIRLEIGHYKRTPYPVESTHKYHAQAQPTASSRSDYGSWDNTEYH